MILPGKQGCLDPLLTSGQRLFASTNESEKQKFVLEIKFFKSIKNRKSNTSFVTS